MVINLWHDAVGLAGIVMSDCPKEIHHMDTWSTVFTGFAAFAGGLAGSLILAGLTQTWIANRELRNRRDQLRLELYWKIVDLVLDNQFAIDSRGANGETPAKELQRKRFDVSHRLKLIGSERVRKAYQAYSSLVYNETAFDTPDRPKDPNEVTRARDQLVEAMQSDIQKGWSKKTGAS